MKQVVPGHDWFNRKNTRLSRHSRCVATSTATKTCFPCLFRFKHSRRIVVGVYWTTANNEKTFSPQVQTRRKPTASARNTCYCLSGFMRPPTLISTPSSLSLELFFLFSNISILWLNMHEFQMHFNCLGNKSVMGKQTHQCPRVLRNTRGTVTSIGGNQPLPLGRLISVTECNIFCCC